MIPLLYSGRGDEDDVKEILDKYKKGQVISVKGFVSQKNADVVDEDGKTSKQYKNTYYITTFLSSEMEVDYDEME